MPTALPDQGEFSPDDQDSGVYRALIASTARTDVPEELTAGDSLPPESGEHPIVPLSQSLRPAAIPEIAAPEDPDAAPPPPPSSPVITHSESDDDLDAVLAQAFAEAKIDDVLGLPEHDAEQGIVDAAEFDGNRSNIPEPDVNPAVRAEVERFNRDQINADLKQELDLVLPMGEFLPIKTLRHIGQLLLECRWVKNETDLREAMLIILTGLDSKLGPKLRESQRRIEDLRDLFLERLQMRGYDAIVIKLRGALSA